MMRARPDVAMARRMREAASFAAARASESPSENVCTRMRARILPYFRYIGVRMSLDLLAFGPHPDDIEIGLGGTVARHTAAGHLVGLCDLTEGEMGSNGTPERRRAEALDASRALGALWRENLGWPDGSIAETPEMI